jgi:hypothetical protein
MPEYQVPRIVLNQDDTISIQVNVYGFDAGEPIEISGYVTQENGAVSAFYSVQEVPAHDQDGAGIWIKSVQAASPSQFVPGFPITVIVRVTQAWVTTLDPESPGNLPQIEPSGGYGAWGSGSFSATVSLVRPPGRGLSGDQRGD